MPRATTCCASGARPSGYLLGSAHQSPRPARSWWRPRNQPSSSTKRSTPTSAAASASAIRSGSWWLKYRPSQVLRCTGRGFMRPPAQGRRRRSSAWKLAARPFRPAVDRLATTSGVPSEAPGARKTSPGASHSPSCHWRLPSCSHSMLCWWLPDQARWAPKTRPWCSVAPGVVTTAPGQLSWLVRPRRLSRRQVLRDSASTCSRNSWLCWPAKLRTASASGGSGRVAEASHWTSSGASPRLCSVVCTRSTSCSSSDSVRRACRRAVSSCSRSSSARPGACQCTSARWKASEKSRPPRCASSALWPNQPTPKPGITVSGWSWSSMKDGSGRLSRRARPGVAPSARRGPQ